MRKESSTNALNENQLNDTCPLVFALGKIGTRWKPYIIWKLLNGSLRFTELRRQIPSITERMLILSLKELVQDDIIQRTDYNTVPPKVEYSLTEAGRRLEPMLKSLYNWGETELKEVSSS